MSANWNAIRALRRSLQALNKPSTGGEGTDVDAADVDAAALLIAADDLTASEQTTFRGDIGVKTFGRAQPRRNVSVHAGGYITPSTSTLNFGPAGETVWRNGGNATRITRHLDRIDRVQFRFGDKTSVTDFKCWIGRYVNNYLKIVAQTENLVPHITSNVVNTIRLAVPLSGARQGDITGIYLNQPGAVNVLATVAQTNCPAYYEAVALADNCLTAGVTLRVGTSIPVRFFGSSADIILKGDSIASGHKVSASLFDSVSAQAWTELDSMRILQNDGQGGTHGGFYCANHSIQGDTMTAIESVWAAQMIDQKPKLGVLWLTGNDIGAGGTTEGNILTTVKATFMAKLTAMLNAAFAVDLPMVVMTISPRGGWEAWRKSARNQYNTEAQAIVQAVGYGGLFSWLDLDPTVEDPGTPDALLAAYADADGYHYSSAGQTAVGTALRDHVFANHAHKL